MRVIRAIIFILICIGLIWLGIILITRAFSGGGNKEETPVVTAKLSDLANTDAVTSMYIDGPIVANQDHVSIRISIDKNTAKIERISGYDNDVVVQQTFPNTTSSYLAFLSALDSLGFTSGNNDASMQDPAGACPFSNRYLYTVNDAGSDVYHYWTTSCGGGTYGGQRNNTRMLFLDQIPTKNLYDISESFAL